MMHAKQGGCIILSVFALLPNKTEATYSILYRELFNGVNGNEPEDILLDFEKSVMNTINNTRPKIVRKGCFYGLRLETHPELRITDTI